MNGTKILLTVFFTFSLSTSRFVRPALEVLEKKRNAVVIKNNGTVCSIYINVNNALL
jgi:hypothetical protein